MAFDELSGTERRLWQAFPRGELVDLRDNGDDGPHRAAGWQSHRRVRAEVIASLLTGSAPAVPGAIPAMRLAGAHVIGELCLAHADVQHPIDFEHCLFDGDIELAECRTRSVRMRGCFAPHLGANRIDLRGELQAQGCQFGSLSLYAARVFEVEISGSRFINPDGVGLYCDLLAVEAAMYCHDIQVEGMVRLPGAHITGYLELDGAQIVNTEGPAILADGLIVDNGVFCRPGFTEERNRFTCDGQIHLSGAQIKGGLLFDGARLSAPRGASLISDQSVIDGGLSLREVTSVGQIRLRATQINGQLTLNAAQLNNPGGVALDAEQAVINGALLCHDGFTCGGDVRLFGAQITGQLDLGGTPALTHTDPPHRSPSGRLSGMLDLREVRVGALRDDADTWPAQIRMDGLSYDRLSPHLDARQRLRWLARQPDGYHPQPYQQLAGHYRKLGHDHDARLVLLAAQRRRRTTLNPAARLWGITQDVITGYGYRPWLAGLWLLALLTVGTIFFTTAPPQPLKRGEGPDFSALAYVLDLLLPIINLGQESAWNPRGTTQALAYALILSGWVLATAVVAGITRALTRN